MVPSPWCLIVLAAVARLKRTVGRFAPAKVRLTRAPAAKNGHLPGGRGDCGDGRAVSVWRCCR